MTQELLLLGGGATSPETATEPAARGQDVPLIDDTVASPARAAGVAARGVVVDAAGSAVGRTGATADPLGPGTPTPANPSAAPSERPEVGG